MSKFLVSWFVIVEDENVFCLLLWEQLDNDIVIEPRIIVDAIPIDKFFNIFFAYNINNFIFLKDFNYILKRIKFFKNN